MNNARIYGATFVLALAAGCANADSLAEEDALEDGAPAGSSSKADAKTSSEKADRQEGAERDSEDAQGEGSNSSPGQVAGEPADDESSASDPSAPAPVDSPVSRQPVAPAAQPPGLPPPAAAGAPLIDAEPGNPLGAVAPQEEAPALAAPAPMEPTANTNVSLGGSQDFGFFRSQLDNNVVPAIGSFDAAGFFAEHHTQLPTPDCGNRVCLQAMLGVMGNLMNGNNCTMLQLGLNSPIAADPGNRPPLSLAVVVDVSGSMQEGNKIDFVREGLNILIDGLKDEDAFSLVTYSSDTEVVYPFGPVEGNRVELRGLVDSLVADGGTNLNDGLEEGYLQIFRNYDSARQNRVIMLSDGNPTVGEQNSNRILAMSEQYNSRGVGLTTIGLGSDFNVDLMRGLAQQADGNYYFLENSGAVSEVFDEELSFFTVPIAFDLKLEVTTGADYDFGRAVGSPLWVSNLKGGILEVPSVFVAHRESAADITEEGGRRGGGSALLLELMPREAAVQDAAQTEAEVATVNVEFREPGSEEVIKDTIFVNYPHAAWELLETGFFDNVNSDSTDVSVVQKSFIMLNIYVGMESAVAAYHENGRDPSQSIAELEALLAAVRDYNEEVQDEDIEFDLGLVQQLIDVMIANSVRPPPPFEIPVDPWPAD